MPRRSTKVVLTIVSPCEHGVEHHVKSVVPGSEFWVPECKDSRRRPRYHKATADKYPNTEELD